MTSAIMSKIRKRREFSTSIFPGGKWYCAIVNPNCWHRAELELYSLGFRTFLPKVRRWVTHARVKQAKEKPLLGRYLFVEVDYDDDDPANSRQSFGTVRNVNGIESLVSVSGKPVAFPSHWVEVFRMRYMAGEWDFVTQAPVHYVDEAGENQVRINQQIPIGARVKVIEGQFNDMLATITERHKRKVTFKLLNSRSYATMHERSVRAA